MKHFLVTMMVGFMLFVTQQAFAQQGFGTNQPDRSAAVDIVSTKRGLLIPRIALTSTTSALPVTAPANSLLVYNTAATSDVTPGFYYWVTDKWVRFVASDTEKTEIVAAGNNVDVEENTVGNTTTYTVGIADGTAGNQLLVTDATTNEAKWVDGDEFIDELLDGLIVAGNALDYDATTNTIKFDGTLSEATAIATDGTNTLTISGLSEVTDLGATDFVMVMDTNGLLKKMTATNLVADAIADGVGKTLTGDGITVTAGTTAGTDASVANSVLADVTLGIADDAITTDKIADGNVTTEKIADDAVTAAKIAAGTADNQVLVTKESSTTPGEFGTEWQDQSSLVSANNGLTKDADNNIQLGGNLISATTIQTGLDADGTTANAANTLKIAGLTAGDAADRIVVAEGEGVLRTVARSIKLPVAETGAYDVSAQTGYDASAQEIYVDATADGGDVTINLPTASTDNMGQVINIKKTGMDEDFYVNIDKVDGATVIYGALPHQGWVIKSDGNVWKVVGRN